MYVPFINFEPAQMSSLHGIKKSVIGTGNGTVVISYREAFTSEVPFGSYFLKNNTLIIRFQM